MKQLVLENAEMGHPIITDSTAQHSTAQHSTAQHSTAGKHMRISQQGVTGLGKVKKKFG